MSDNPQNPNLEDLFGTFEQFETAIKQLKEQGGPKDDADYEDFLTIYFELPFQVPWPDRPITVHFATTYIILLLHPRERQYQDFHGYQTTRVVTGVTMAGPAIPAEDLTQEMVSPLFDFGLDFLNGFLTAYSIVTKDGDIGPVTLPMLSPMSIWGSVRTADREMKTDRMLQLNIQGITYIKDTIPDEIGAAIMGFANALSRTGHPFLTSWQLRIEGEHQLRSGRYHVGVILLANAFEARVNELLRYFLHKEGKSDDEIATTLARSLFRTRVSSQLHPRLGGVFDLTRPGVMKHWHERMHRLRNRIIHVGYRPSKQEANHAQQAMVQAWDYIMRLTRKKSASYPELAPFLPLRGEHYMWPKTIADDKLDDALSRMAPLHDDVLVRKRPESPPA